MNINTGLIIGVLFCITFSIQAQNSDSIKQNTLHLKKEIGLTIFTMCNLRSPNYFNQDKWTYDTKLFHGLVYKQKLQKYYFRSQLNFSNETYNIYSEIWFGKGTDQGNTKSATLSAGLEKRFDKKLFQPFIALDLMCGIEQKVGANYFEGGDLYYTRGFTYYDRNNISFGLSPSIGISFKPIRQLTIDVETSFVVLSSYLENKQTYYDLTEMYGVGIYEKSYHSWNFPDYYSNPLKIAVLYNF